MVGGRFVVVLVVAVSLEEIAVDASISPLLFKETCSYYDIVERMNDYGLEGTITTTSSSRRRNVWIFMVVLFVQKMKCNVQVLNFES